MTIEKLAQAQKINRKIKDVEDKIIELQKYQKLLKGERIKNITITYEEEGNCCLFDQNKVPVELVQEMNEKWLNELNDERNKLLKEFTEL